METIALAQGQGLIRDLETPYQADSARQSPMEPDNGSLDERRRILSQQAERMKGHYQQIADERTEWQKRYLSVKWSENNILCQL